MANEATTTQERPTKSQRDSYLERLKGRYPDKSWDDDEAIYGQANADYDDFENQLNGYRDRESAFSNMFVTDPRSARLVMDWKNGQDPAVGLIRLFGNDIREALDDPKKQDEIAEANKEYMERVAKEKEYEDIYNKNLEETKATLDGLVSDGTYTDEDIDNAMSSIMTIVRDAIMGKFSQETIDLMLKANNHDVDVEQASQEGEVRGRNDRITEKLRKSQRGDGTASLDGKNGGGGAAVQKDYGAVGRNYGSSDIWERGGFQRRRRE